MHVLFLGKKFAKGIKNVAKAKVTLNFSNFTGKSELLATQYTDIGWGTGVRI